MFLISHGVLTIPSTRLFVLTATKVDRTLLELAAISVRYCFAQCLACVGLGTIGEIVDISGASAGRFNPSSSARRRLFKSDMLYLSAV